MTDAGLHPGEYNAGPADGVVQVFTGREGMAARVGHDLTLDVTQWGIRAIVGPGGPADTRIQARFDAGSLRVREGHGGAKPLSARDIAQIERTTAGTVLLAGQHPDIAFDSTAITLDGGGAGAVDGALTLAGRTNAVRVPFHVQWGEGEVVVAGGVAVLQSAWGITPYSALMGSLRVRDRIDIAFQLRVPLTKP